MSQIHTPIAAQVSASLTPADSTRRVDTIADRLDGLDYAVEGLAEVLARTEARLAPVVVPQDSRGSILDEIATDESQVARRLLEATGIITRLVARLDELQGSVQL